MMDPLIPASEVLHTLSEAWGPEMSPVGCPLCKQAFLVSSRKRDAVCPNCAQSTLLQQPIFVRPEPPELLIPFRVVSSSLQPIVEKFVNELWLRPDDFNASAIVSRLTPIYLPMWLVDSRVVGTWQAEAGFNYQVKSSRDSYRSGEWQANEVIETRVRWEPRLGTVDRAYQNISAPALTRHQPWMQSLGDFQFQMSEPYRADRIGQAVIHVPDLAPEPAWPLAQESVKNAARKDCQASAGADHIRNCSVAITYSELNWTQLLLPAYTSHYKDDEGRVHMLYINGQSGAISGDRLASQKKGWKIAGIAAAFAVGIFLVSLVLMALAAVFPPISILGILGVLVALGLMIYAIVPAVYPWQWNRKYQVLKISSQEDRK